VGLRLLWARTFYCRPWVTLRIPLNARADTVAGSSRVGCAAAEHTGAAMSQELSKGGSSPPNRLPLSRSQWLKFAVLVVAQFPAALSHFFGLPWTGSIVQYIAAVALFPCAIVCLVLDLRVIIPILRGDDPPTRRVAAAVAVILIATVLLYV
jgi:hypothetical protein